MRGWWLWGVLAVMGCDPASTPFGADAAPDDATLSDRGIDMALRDRGIDMAPPPDAALDLAPPPDAAPDMLADAQVDAALDMAIDMAPDQSVDMAIDMAPDQSVDAGVDMAPDLGVDMAHDMAPDQSVDMLPIDGPLCGSLRRLPDDGVLGLFGPPDVVDYQGCNRVGAAWSAFIDLDAPRSVIIKPGVGFVQRGFDCDGGAGQCRSGPVRFDLPAGRSRFVFVGTESVRVVSTPLCDNGADDDADGLVDLDDPGCARPDDPTEIETPAAVPACSNGQDDDGDGRTDWPFDLGCPHPGSAVEACPGVAPSAVTSTTPERVDLRGVAGRPAALFCADAADMIEVLLVAPFSGLVVVTADSVGAQGFEVRHGCERVITCGAAFAEGRLAVRAGDLVRVRMHGRPEWLRWTMAPPVTCGNGLDDDGDGLIDLADPGCRSVDDLTEADPGEAPVCSNGVDDDRDRATDFPEEFACLGPGGVTEVDACAVAAGTEARDPSHHVPRAVVAGACGGGARPEVGVTLPLRRPHRIRVARGIAHLRTDCADPASAAACLDDGGLIGPVDGDVTLYLEDGARLDDPPLVPVNRCANGIDDDGDGLIDLDDRGCTDRFDDDEADPAAPPACDDGIDNDADGFTDWPADPHCQAPGDPSEASRCLAIPEVAPIERLVQIGNVDHLPITESIEDGRPVYAVLVPFLIDRPGRRTFAGNAAVNWVPLVDCAPVREVQGFGIDRVVSPEVGQLEMRLEVDVEAVDPWIAFGTHPLDCRNGVDDDADGLIDSADPGCARQPWTEVDAAEPPECADAVDNDGDGAIDADDPECLGANDLYEGGVCPDDFTLAPVSASTSRWVYPEGSPRFGLPCGPGTLQRSAVIPLVLERAARVTVRTAQGQGDPVLTLEADCRQPLACGDDGAPHLQAQVVTFLEAGRYAIRVGRWDTTETAPIRVDVTIQ